MGGVSWAQGSPQAVRLQSLQLLQGCEVLLLQDSQLGLHLLQLLGRGALLLLL